MLDVLLPKIELQLKSWSACINDAGTAVPGERLTEVTIMLRAKFRNYMQAVLEKLVENVSSANAVSILNNKAFLLLTEIPFILMILL